MRFHYKASSSLSSVLVMVGISLLAPHPIVVTAQVTSNDLCQNAQPIVIGSNPLLFNATFATVDVEVTNNCLGPALSGGTPLFKGIWFNLTGTGQRMVARVCNSGSAYISVFVGGCNPSTLQCVAGTTNSCGSERFSFDTVAGTAYKVLVQPNDEGDISIFEAPPRGNDLCVNAQPVVIGSNPLQFNATYATTDVEVTNDCLGPDLSGGTPFFKGIWFNLTGTGRRMVARVCNSGNAYISVFVGGCNPSTLQCVAGTSTLSCASEQFSFDTVAGTAYQVLVQPNDEGDISIFEVPAVPTSPVMVPVTAPSLPAPVTSPMKVPVNVPSLPVPVAIPSRMPTKRPTPRPSTRPQPSPPTNETTPTRAPTSAPTKSPCGLFRRSIFCPFQFRGIFGRFIRRIFG